MKNKRMLSTAMLALLLLSAAACAEDPGTTPTETASQTDASSAETAAPEALEDTLFPKLNYAFPEADCGGEVIRILTRSDELFASEMDVAEADGDTINDAVFYRNLAVEERYNVTIEGFSDATGNDWHGPENAERVVLSGDTTVDMIVGSSYGIMPLTANSLYMNLRDLNNLDLTQKCWSQELLKRATIHGQTFAASGSIALNFFKRAYALALNRPLFSTYDVSVDDLYEQVKAGTWTMDRMIEITKDIYQDVNGDGKPDANDVHGCGILLNCMNDGWWSSCDISMATVDADGALQIDVDLDKLETVNEKLRNYIWVSGGVLPMSEDTIYSREITAGKDQNPFYEDKLCMTTIRMEFTETPAMRNMKSDYGIVPYPKFDENQSQYYSYIHDAFSIVMIPVSCEDPEIAAMIMQALAVEGHNTVMPAYYDIVLSEKYMRDQTSVDMLNIIYEGVTLDTGWLFSNMLNYAPQLLLRHQVWENKSDLQSTYASLSKQLEKSLAKINDGYQKITEGN